ncbi:hypothetical protein [Dactylosporangium sp. NPDC051484]|uniref:hypothetical protein n=1 Tax=Dactylosporangium sp. NPDC051484 TaxID=3154942 RepID=UPI00344D35FC
MREDLRASRRILFTGVIKAAHRPIRPGGAACVALLSGRFPATTGGVVHVDGGHRAAA